MADRQSTVLSLLSRTQRDLERLYELEPGPEITAFVQFDEAHAHETVVVRQHEHDVELAVLLPADLAPGATRLDDASLQVIEGASHFVLLSERARTELPATQLELEIQAEVDKFALLVHAVAAGEVQLQRLHHWLFERVHFLHHAKSEAGQRYRTANDVAARLCSRVFLRDVGEQRGQLLRRFYRSGQAEKIRLALAA
jgi:hypothetical protein